jgi:hypothetical protein
MSYLPSLLIAVALLSGGLFIMIFRTAIFRRAEQGQRRMFGLPVPWAQDGPRVFLLIGAVVSVLGCFLAVVSIFGLAEG